MLFNRGGTPVIDFIYSGYGGSRAGRSHPSRRPLSRTKLSLALEKAVDKKAPIKSADKKAPIKSAAQKDMIIAYLTDHVSGKNADFVELLGVKSTRVKTLLRELTEEDIVVAEGERKARTYRLKS